MRRVTQRSSGVDLCPVATAPVSEGRGPGGGGAGTAAGCSSEGTGVGDAGSEWLDEAGAVAGGVKGGRDMRPMT
jgi:hypothetical protein